MDFKKTMETIGPVAGPIGSIASSLIGGLFSKSEGDKQREFAAEQNQLNRQFQHDEAELAYNRNERTRNLQNQWNSEEQQVSRLKNAGINPYNAMAGSSGTSVTSAGNTASAGNASGSQMSYQQANMQWISEIANIGLVAAQTRLMNSEANRNDASSKNIELQSYMQDMQNQVFEKYGKIQALVGINKDDAMRGYYDAQRAFMNTVAKLNDDELRNMRPLQRNNLIAQEAATYAKTELDKILAIKNETERQIALKKLNWELNLMANMSVYYSASAFNQRQQGMLAGISGETQIFQQGLLSAQTAESLGRHDMNRWQTNNMRQTYYFNNKLQNVLGTSFMKTVKSQLEMTHNINKNGLHWLGPIVHTLGSGLPFANSPYSPGIVNPF